MRNILLSSDWRKGCRRAVETECQCLSADGFQLLGTEVVDISPYGMRIRADVIAEVGDEVILSFKAPGGREWFDAEARVTRILWGNREEDDGAELGLEFTEISLETRFRLRCYLREIPPPVPRRPLRDREVMGLAKTTHTECNPAEVEAESTRLRRSFSL